MMRTRIQEKIKQAEGTSHSVPSLDQPQIYRSTYSRFDDTIPATSVETMTNDCNNIEEQQTTTNIPMYQHSALNGEDLGSQGLQIYPGFGDDQTNDWPSADPLNTFEPLVRQLFGNDEALNLGDIDIFHATQGFSPSGLSQEPLLAEFTSGLEGFM
ncbi:hypothetical protein DL98DRAFT_518811 [Cadophora sp. DSE1049]|nr:hypothetical protein DL98DRAFT_518811 [Cadophora sp. DSE1049]